MKAITGIEAAALASSASFAFPVNVVRIVHQEFVQYIHLNSKIIEQKKERRKKEKNRLKHKQLIFLSFSLKLILN
jgi:hypothetical protein